MLVFLPILSHHVLVLLPNLSHHVTAESIKFLLYTMWPIDYVVGPVDPGWPLQ